MCLFCFCVFLLYRHFKLCLKYPLTVLIKFLKEKRFNRPKLAMPQHTSSTLGITHNAHNEI